jgi:bifunctional DNase/RNase
MRAVDLAGIALDANSGAPLVVLRERDEPHRLLPIFVGGPEATAIAIAASGQRTPRPMTHDVTVALVAALDGTIDAIEVNDLHDGTFFATINLSGPAGSRKVGSRPSDAIALAVRTGAPVWVSDAVLDQAGALPGPDDDVEPAALDPARIDAEVESFRSFLDDLDPDDFIDTDVTDNIVEGTEATDVADIIDETDLTDETDTSSDGEHGDG